ncbi:MAG: BatD family protein [Elusimicrobiales bacterium]
MSLIGSIILLLASIQSTAFSQITVSAWVDRKTIPINESFTLTISLSGQNITTANIDFPSLSDFNVYQSGKSSNITIVNGQITTTIEYLYTLLPKRTGRFIIPRIGVFTGKEKYFTKEIEVEITAPSISQSIPQQQTQISPQQYPGKQNKIKKEITTEQLIFAKASVDRKKAYQGQQITLSIKFYTALPIAANPQYFPPTYSNLTSEDLPPPRTGTEIIDGIKYYFVETKTALFGIMSGKAKITPARIIAPVQQELEFDPFDPNFIQKFFSQAIGTKNITVETQPIELEILELPPPPKDFSAAVGNFFITAKIDKQTVHAGDPINIIVEITGKGNIKPITAPQINNNFIKIYDVLSSESISKNNDVIGGTKKFTYIATPISEGTITIEPIKFTFFNIDTKKYETITTDPIKITALKAKEGKTFDFDTSKPLTQIERKGSDINYIRENIPSSVFYRLTNKISSFSFTFDIFIVVIIMILSVVKLKLSSYDINSPLYRYKKAVSLFEKRISRTIKEDRSKTLSVIYESVYEYFSSKLKENISHMSFSKLKDLIKEKIPSVSEQNLKELEDVINRIEFLNFTKTQASQSEVDLILQKVIKLIREIDKEIGR